MAKRKYSEAELDKEYTDFAKKLGQALQKRRRRLDVTPDEVVRMTGIESITVRPLSPD